MDIAHGICLKKKEFTKFQFDKGSKHMSKGAAKESGL